MIRSKLCVLAENVVQDIRTNTMSIFSVVEEINAQGLPLFVPKITFLVLWEKDLTDPAQYDAEFSVNLNEQNLHNAPIHLDFRDVQKHRSVVAMEGLVIPQPGQLIFRIRIQDGPEATCRITVTAPQSVISSS